MYRHTFPCPLGDLLLIATDTHLTGAFFTGQKTIPVNAARMSPGASVPVIREAQAQFEAYFAGRLQVFDVPMAPAGTPFQQDVWRRLCETVQVCDGVLVELQGSRQGIEHVR